MTSGQKTANGGLTASKASVNVHHVATASLRSPSPSDRNSEQGLRDSTGSSVQNSPFNQNKSKRQKSDGAIDCSKTKQNSISQLQLTRLVARPRPDCDDQTGCEPQTTLQRDTDVLPSPTPTECRSIDEPPIQDNKASNATIPVSNRAELSREAAQIAVNTDVRMCSSSGSQVSLRADRQSPNKSGNTAASASPADDVHLEGVNKSPPSHVRRPATSSLAQKRVQTSSEVPRKRPQSRTNHQENTPSWSVLGAAFACRRDGVSATFNALMQELKGALEVKLWMSSRSSGRGQIERPRLELLREACAKFDYRYLMVHQIYCCSHTTFHHGEGFRLNDVHREKCGTLKYILASNIELPVDTFTWLTLFPSPSPAMQPEVGLDQNVRQWYLEALECICALADHWHGLQSECSSRGFPPLVSELQGTLKVRSPVLQQVIFRAILRNMISANDPRFSQHETVFNQNQERSLSDDTSSIANVGRDSQFAQAHYTISQSVFSPQARALNSHSSHHHYPTSTYSTRQAGVFQQARRRSAAQEDVVVGSLVEQRPLPVNRQITSPNETRNEAAVPNHILQRNNLPREYAVRAIPSNLLPNCPRNMESTRPRDEMDTASRPHSVQEATGSINSNNADILTPRQGPPSANAQISTTAVAGANFLFQPPPTGTTHIRQFHSSLVAPLWPLPSTNDSVLTNSSTSTVPSSSSPQTLGQQSTQHSRVHNYQQPPVFNAATHWGLPFGIGMSDGMLPTIPTSALHQVHILSPKITTPTVEQHFRFIRGISIPSKAFSSERHHLQHPVDIPKVFFERTAQDSLGEAGVPVSRSLRPGSLTYRIRCIKTNSGHSVSADHRWVTADHVWPGSIAILFNDEALQCRRKHAYGKDLPVDVTRFVKEGKNILTAAVLDIGPESSESYLVGFEVIETITYTQIKDGIRREPTEDVKKRIIARLRNDDPDVEILNPEITLDLTDPFSTKIFTTPVRGEGCTHDQCFDLDIFLTSRGSTGRDKNEPCPPDEFRCPICKGDVRPGKLVIDGMYEDIRGTLKTMKRLDVDAVKMDASGVWTIKEDEETTEGTEKHHGQQEEGNEEQVATQVDKPCMPVTANSNVTATIVPQVISLDDDDD